MPIYCSAWRVHGGLEVPAVAFVSSGCVHEHVDVDAAACAGCIDELSAGGMDCGACEARGCSSCRVHVMHVRPIGEAA